MSIYDDVKAEIGAGPAWPNKTTFTTVFGYSGGKSLGTFPNKGSATDAGATVTESKFDDTAYRAAQAEYRAHEAKIADAWIERLRAEYPDTSKAIFDIAYSEAYERGHSAGYGEVENYIGDYIDLADKFIAAAKAS